MKFYTGICSCQKFTFWNAWFLRFMVPVHYKERINQTKNQYNYLLSLGSIPSVSQLFTVDLHSKAIKLLRSWQRLTSQKEQWDISSIHAELQLRSYGIEWHLTLLQWWDSVNTEFSQTVFHIFYLRICIVGKTVMHISRIMKAFWTYVKHCTRPKLQFSRCVTS